MIKTFYYIFLYAIIHITIKIKDLKMAEIVKYGNVLNLLPMPQLHAKEMDIFMQVISKMHYTDELELEFDSFEFFKELKRLPQNSNQSFEILFNAFHNFASKVLGFKIDYFDAPNNIHYAFVCFDRLKFDYNTSKIIIRAQSDFYEIIKRYKLGFTQFELLEFADFSSTYTKMLYRLLKQFRTTGILNIEMREFRRLLQIPESYKMCDIDKQVLKPAIKELTAERNLFNQSRIPFKDLKVEKMKSNGRGQGGTVRALQFTFKNETTLDMLNKAYKGTILDSKEKHNALLKILEISGVEPEIKVDFLVLNFDKIPKDDGKGNDAHKIITFKSFEQLERAISYSKIP